ncbi:PP0621 family protein [Massilia consociata]|uniref:PP0621 family protein n=1 Tax=Massilia consociata TaxID=760117 RepID=A0ABV6FLA9_9BURK
MRILFWIALIILVGFAVRAKLRKLVARHEASLREQMHEQQGQQPGRQAPKEIETMTQCAHCGVYFPASEAVHADGHDYCSPGHVRLPPR